MMLIDVHGDTTHVLFVYLDDYQAFKIYIIALNRCLNKAQIPCVRREQDHVVVVVVIITNLSAFHNTNSYLIIIIISKLNLRMQLINA